jgi:hypothetical protein
MKIQDFQKIVSVSPSAVILLEGRRGISEAEALAARDFGEFLARRFPALRFRSGNAEGADQAFSDGVAKVDARRLQIVAPYASHRKKNRNPAVVYSSPDDLSPEQVEEFIKKTAAASPKIGRLLNRWKDGGALAVKATYLLRDSMKVIGHSEEFPKPICGIFFTDPSDPMAGGTGHTIRVCQQESVPVLFQTDWLKWM